MQYKYPLDHNSLEHMQFIINNNNIIIIIYGTYMPAKLLSHLNSCKCILFFILFEIT